MVVVIASTGSVTKRLFTFPAPVDSGLAKWAGQYLNDTLSGLQPGTHQLKQRFEDPGLSPREREFLAALRPALTDAVEDDQSLYVGGAASLLESARGDELDAYQSLLEALERRATLLGVVSRALDPRRPFVRVGVELEHPELRSLSLVGAAYGLANRTLGAVSLVGPVRMDYETAIRSVRGAASELSRFVEDIYTRN
jgi:heat-inducible transcriptional repressor